MRFQNRQRQWTVYEATGDTRKPVRFVTCVRANAKSIAVGTVHRTRNIPKRELLAIEGCFRPRVAFQGARRRRRHR